MQQVVEMIINRRLLTPWSVEDNGAAGAAARFLTGLAGSEPGLQIGKLLTKIKTPGTAANLAKLPELLRKDRWAGVV